jgi:hypothetical protein
MAVLQTALPIDATFLFWWVKGLVLEGVAGGQVSGGQAALEPVNALGG